MKIWAFNEPLYKDTAHLFITNIKRWKIGDEVYINKKGFAQKRAIKDNFVGYYFKSGEDLNIADLFIGASKVRLFLHQKIIKGYNPPRVTILS